MKHIVRGTFAFTIFSHSNECVKERIPENLVHGIELKRHQISCWFACIKSIWMHNRYIVKCYKFYFFHDVTVEIGATNGHHFEDDSIHARKILNIWNWPQWWFKVITVITLCGCYSSIFEVVEHFSDESHKLCGGFPFMPPLSISPEMNALIYFFFFKFKFKRNSIFPIVLFCGVHVSCYKIPLKKANELTVFCLLNEMVMNFHCMKMNFKVRNALGKCIKLICKSSVSWMLSVGCSSYNWKIHLLIGGKSQQQLHHKIF